jgi:putative ABC transport system ATP-binding protein
MTIALITHETDIAEYASRVIVLRDGLIVEDRPIQRRRDAVEELRRLPATSAVRLPGLEGGEEGHA